MNHNSAVSPEPAAAAAGPGNSSADGFGCAPGWEAVRGLQVV